MKEATNTGFTGEGYANVANEAGSYVTYDITAEKEGKYTLYISFANGGNSTRGYTVSVGDKTLIEDGSMESTGGWTTWKTQMVELELPAGHSELKFESLSKDGMANIDYIGWMDTALHAGKVDLNPIGIHNLRRAPASVPADRYYVDFGSRDNSAGVYLNRNARVFRVNGTSRGHSEQSEGAK